MTSQSVLYRHPYNRNMVGKVMVLFLTIIIGVLGNTVGYINGNTSTIDVLHKSNTEGRAIKSALDNQTIPNVVNTTVIPGSKIITFTMELNDTKTPFHKSKMTCLWLIRKHSIVFTTVTLTGYVVVVNSFAMYVFLKKTNRSPLTIILSCLAFTDALTAIFVSVSDLIEISSGKLITVERGVMWYPAYPSCFFVSLMFHFGRSFHLMSVFLTAVLSVQKALSVVFPIWSKTHMNNRLAAVTSLVVAGISVLIYSPVNVGFVYSFAKSPDRCCLTTGAFGNVLLPAYLVVNVTYVVCITVVCVSTLIVFCKLICLRSSLQVIDTPSVQKRNRRSAIIVVVICIIFMLSEVMPVIIMLKNITDSISASPLFHYEIYSILDQYQDLSLLIGFSFNFMVYLAMGQHLRKAFVTGLRDICKRFSCYK